MTEEKAFGEMYEDLIDRCPNFDYDLLTLITDIKNIEKGKYKPIISYAITDEDSIIVTDFMVVAVDYKTEKDFIYFFFNQAHGRGYAWDILGRPEENGGTNEKGK